MPGVLDFLFEGRPPSSVSTYGQTVENIPKWLSDYTQGLIARANVIAAEPYQAYEGPRISGFTPDQMAAFDMTRQNVGAYEPALGAAGTLFAEAGSTNPLNVAAPYLSQASQTFPGAASAYMDPYIENVLKRQETLSTRNLTENLLPALQDTFVGAGQFGSDRMGDLAGRVIRDTAEGLQGQQLGALSQAYQQAGQMFGQDAQRMLQAGMGAGTLAGQTGELQLAAGQNMGALAEALQRMRFADTAALEAVGAQQRGLTQGSLDLAYQDFLQQRDYPQDQVNWMSQIIRGLPTPTATTTTNVGPADVYGPSPLSQIASLYSTFKGFQDLNQDEG